MKRLLQLSLFAAVLLAAAGCAKDLVVEEVLQLPPHAKIYTAYNLWYENPLTMTCINYQKGRIIPFGTEVEIVRATENGVQFRTLPDRTLYKISFNPEYRMQPMSEYLRDLFTTRTAAELSEGIRPIVFEKIRRGIVERGMLRNEVRLACGPPCRYKTPDEKLDTWLFWSEFLVGKRIIFNNDRVMEILEL